MILEFELARDAEPVLIKKYLHRQGISKHLWRRLTQQNCICLNGIPVNGTLTYAQPGDKICCMLEEKSDIAASEIPLEIIYEDKHILAVNKPSGLLVHPIVKGQTDTLANAVQYYYEHSGQNCIFHPIHRLDKFTSGLIIIAKTPFAQHAITSKAAPLFHREYLALAENKFTFLHGKIAGSIGRKPGSNMLREIIPTGQAAMTYYKVIAQTNMLALVHLLPVTGRTHQLRVHMSSIGHPLYGDDLYGASNISTNRQALHSYRCNLTHPITRQSLLLTAPIPSYLQEIMQNNFPLQHLS